MSPVETFLTVITILAMVALGMFLIHRLNSQHSDRIAAFRYARFERPVSRRAPRSPRGSGREYGDGTERTSHAVTRFGVALGERQSRSASRPAGNEPPQ